jgi:hypothetical protein
MRHTLRERITASPRAGDLLVRPRLTHYLFPRFTMEEKLDFARVHEKLAEALVFLAKMIEEEPRLVGDKQSFERYLSAFLSASMSVRGGFQYRQDRLRNSAIKAWRAQWESTLAPEEKSLYEVMHKARVDEVHDSGPSCNVGREGVEFGIGDARLPGGKSMISISGPPGMPLTVLPRRTYTFTINGTDRRATDACREYLALLQRMVAQCEADHP